MAKKLENRVAVVTGASKGIGAQIARRMAEEGAKVVVNYARSQGAADTLVNEIKAAGGQAIAVKADMRNRAEVAQLFAETDRALGPVDILVNNAGVYTFAPLAAIDEGHYRENFDLNVLGLIYATQEAAKRFEGRGGNVINIGSVVGETPASPGGLIYSATKAAVSNLTRGLAQELGPNVRVNALAPGLVKTEGFSAAEMDPAFEAYAVSRTPVKRVGAPDDVAKVAVFLASDDSAWMSGETITVSGGMRF
jgi:3-oxoacyl-[acyl-carrier protein] reductase